MPDLGKNWPRYAMVLDLHLSGQSYKAIACQLGISTERVRQIIVIAKWELARCVWNLPRHRHQWDADKQRYEVAH